MDYLVKTRIELLNYLRNNSTKEAHDLSVGIMQGVIGYLDPAFIGQTQVLLRGVMRELLIHPADNLLNLALADHTRNQLDKMLQMAIPTQIKDAMDQTGLEPHMSQFLTDEHIHSN